MGSQIRYRLLHSGLDGACAGAHLARACVGKCAVLRAHDATRTADACGRATAGAWSAGCAVSLGAAEIVGGETGALEQERSVGKDLANDFKSNGRVDHSCSGPLGLARAGIVRGNTRERIDSRVATRKLFVFSV